MLPYPFDASFQKQQPLLMLGDRVLAKTSSGASLALLRTAAGVRHRFGLLARFPTLWRSAALRLRPAALALLQQELPRRVSELTNDALAYFLVHIVPAFSKRDVSEDDYLDLPLANRGTGPVDWSVELVKAVLGIPCPVFVTRSLWLCGRVWRLQEQEPRPNCWQVFTADGCFGLTGEYFRVGTLAAHWRNEVAMHVSQAAQQLALHVGSDDTLPVIEARREVESQGFLERGDLLFLPGSPPRLGHVLPPHYNSTLGRNSHRDLAVTAPLTLPPTPFPSRSVLAICQRTTQGWGHFSPPNGLCLGSDPPNHAQESPGVGLASYLRWAAERLAENGAFHSSDGAGATSDDENAYYT